MAEIRYMISDVSKMLNTQASVLRYFEYHLSLNIKRTELGHRYYTQEDIDLLSSVKALKDKGFDLKVIKAVLPYIDKVKNMDEIKMKDMKERMEIALGLCGNEARENLRSQYGKVIEINMEDGQPLMKPSMQEKMDREEGYPFKKIPEIIVDTKDVRPIHVIQKEPTENKQEDNLISEIAVGKEQPHEGQGKDKAPLNRNAQEATKQTESNTSVRSSMSQNVITYKNLAHNNGGMNQKQTSPKQVNPKPINPKSMKPKAMNPKSANPKAVNPKNISIDRNQMAQSMQVTLKQESLKQESLKQESLKQESLKQESLKQESLRQESLKQESLKQEPLKQESLRQESLKQESLKQEPLKQESLRQESLKQESLKRESQKQESFKQGLQGQKKLIQEISKAEIPKEEEPKPEESNPEQQIKEEMSVVPVQPVRNEVSKISEEKVEQFKKLMTAIVGNAIKQNNQNLVQEINETVTDSVVREMDYMLSLREAREEQKAEERFRQIDRMLRETVNNRQQAAATKEGKRKHQSKFFKKNKVRI